MVLRHSTWRSSSPALTMFQPGAGFDRCQPTHSLLRHTVCQLLERQTPRVLERFAAGCDLGAITDCI